MQQLLLVLQVLLAAGIIALVLLQQGRGADAGASFGGGSSGSLFGSRGPATFLAKVTALVAAVFFVNSIGLAYLASKGRTDHSIIDTVGSQQQSAVPQPAESPAAADDMPTAPGAGGAGGGTGGATGGSDVPTAPAPPDQSQ